ncbi:MAG: nucleoside triphosphate diphosphatase, partial [Gaiellales bacterium]|nr:nucleoside triphosphate diphosphatase [Gaiellales bacterium]
TTAEAFGDLEGELAELRDELRGLPEPEPEREPLPALAGELGDVLFACVNVARRHNCDPELALRAASARFRARIELAERLADGEGVAFRAVGMVQQEHYYQAAKQSLRKSQ